MKRDIELSHEYVAHGSLAMTAGSVLRIEDGREMVIYVWEGELWLTQEGERRDRILSAGDCLRLERQGVTIAMATASATVSLTAPQPELYAKRVTLTKAGTGVLTELYSAREKSAESLWTRLFAPYSRPTTAAL
jgi:hypothetical protein